jgi:hypothetical protein
MFEDEREKKEFNYFIFYNLYATKIPLQRGQSSFFLK